MNQVHVNGRPQLVATSWNELTRAQVLRVVQVLFTPATEYQLQARLICLLFQLFRWSRRRLAWQFIRMPLIDVWDLRPHVAFLLNAPVALTRQVLPKIRRRWWARPWYGPGDQLRGLSFTEWIDAEAALFYYRREKKEQYLNRLVAVLYRPGRSRADTTTGDHREPYAQHALDARSAQAGQLPLATRQAILVYYDSCRQQMMGRYPEVFEGDEDEDENPNRVQPVPQNPAPAYLRILNELATGAENYELVGRQPIGNILYNLSERLKRAAELEAQLKARAEK